MLRCDRLAIALLAILPLPALAQTPLTRAIVTTVAPIMLVPDAARVPLRTAAVGTSLEVLGEEGDWLNVRFRDPQFGPRVGYVETRFVRVIRPETQPLDLSVPERAAQPAPPQQPVSTRAARERANGETPGRVFIDTSFWTYIPREKTFTDVTSSGTGTMTAEYTVPNAYSLFANIHVALGHSWGIGVRPVWVEYMQAARARVAVGSATSAFSGARLLDRKDINVDFYATYLRNEPRWTAMVFGGPTLFHTRMEFIQGVTFLRPTTTSVTITGISVGEDAGYTIGFNGGFDAAHYPWRHVGFGAGAHLNYGSFTMEDGDGTFPVGSYSLLAGARFRF